MEGDYLIEKSNPRQGVKGRQRRRQPPSEMLIDPVLDQSGRQVVKVTLWRTRGGLNKCKLALAKYRPRELLSDGDLPVLAFSGPANELIAIFRKLKGDGCEGFTVVERPPNQQMMHPGGQRRPQMSSSSDSSSIE